MGSEREIGISARLGPCPYLTQLQPAARGSVPLVMVVHVSSTGQCSPSDTTQFLSYRRARAPEKTAHQPPEVTCPALLWRTHRAIE